MPALIKPRRKNKPGAGRPKVAESQQGINVSLRVPRWLLTSLDALSGRRTTLSIDAIRSHYDLSPPGPNPDSKPPEK